MEVVTEQKPLFKPKFSGFGEFLGYLPLWRRKSRRQSGLIILSRHGRSILNEHKRLQPWTPDGDLLSPSGRIQAQLLARILRFVELNAIYSSDFLRVEETAQIVLAHQRVKRGLQVHTEMALRDFNFGKLCGLSTSAENNEVARQYPEVYELLKQQPELFYAPEGDRVAEFASRATARLESVASENIGKVILLVSHELWIKSALYWAWKRPLSELNQMKIRNASISILEFHKSTHQLNVLVANDVNHLS